MTTDITPEELGAMNDTEFITYLKKFPYPSQWTNPKSNFTADYRLALIQGNRYIQTGNLNSFKATLL